MTRRLNARLRAVEALARARMPRSDPEDWEALGERLYAGAYVLQDPDPGAGFRLTLTGPGQRLTYDVAGVAAALLR